jgi:hypothetical protein
MSASSLENLFNNCPLPDVEIAAALSVLLQRGYLEATPVIEE